MPVLGTIGSHAFRAGRSLHNSPLVDRLLRGRIWVGLLGVLLIGLVALNVSLLRLNAQAGRNAELAKALRIQNDRLTGKVARLSSGERIESAGLGLGMVMAEPKQVRYLSIGTADGTRAAKTIRSSQSGYGAEVGAMGAGALSTSPSTALTPLGVAAEPDEGAVPAPTAETPAAPAVTAPAAPTDGATPEAPAPAPVPPTGPVAQAPASEG